MHRLAEKTEVPIVKFVDWLGIVRSKFYGWRARYGKANEHNGKVPRDQWIEPWERTAIIDYFDKHPLEGYRRLVFVCDFSTTGPIERAASEIVLMDAMQSYFDYVLQWICGTPEVTLLGSTSASSFAMNAPRCSRRGSPGSATCDLGASGRGDVV